MAESSGMCLSETDEMSRNEDPFSMRIKNWLESVTKFSFKKLTSIGIGELITFFQLVHFDVENSLLKIVLCISGCLLYACALMIHFHYLKSTFYISVKKTKDDPITFFLWHIGVIAGCICCGLNSHTWPTRKVNVSNSI